MLTGFQKIIGLAALLLVAACDRIPYYNQSLDWFSWSRYDPEVNAIVGEIPPPGNLEAGPMSGPNAMMPDPAHGVGGSAGSASLAGTTVATSVGVADPASGIGTSPSAPLVGIRNSVGPSVTWRSTRGTP